MALRNERSKEATRAKEEDFGQTKLGRLRKTLWDLFEYPSTSKGAQVRITHACSQLSMSVMSDIVFFNKATFAMKWEDKCVCLWDRE